MVNSLLSTFDAGLERTTLMGTYYWLTEHLFKLPGLTKPGHIRDASRWRRLYASLRGLDVDIRTYKPSKRDVEEALDLLEKQIGSSDMVFHNKTLMSANPFVSDDLASRVDELIRERYLYKSHITEVDKLHFARVMEEARIPIPETMEAEEYLAKGNGPVVLKPKKACEGVMVLYLGREQIERFFDEKMWRTRGLKPKYMPRPEEYIVQEFIETPGDRYTSYRVFTVGGDILGCVLHASRETTSGRKSRDYRRVAEFFDSVPIISNVAAGAIQIPVSHNYFTPLSQTKQQILMDHSIGPNELEMPKPLEELARRAGRELTKHGIIIAGQDWVQDTEGNFYFLEANPSPGLRIFRTLYFGGKNTQGLSAKVANFLIAQALRKYDALNLT